MFARRLIQSIPRAAHLFLCLFSFRIKRMFRIYVERKQGFANEAERIRCDAVDFLGVQGITAVRYLNRYDIEHADEELCRAAAMRVFAEPQSDICMYEPPAVGAKDTVIAWEYLPGQYDQRADSAEQCLSLLTAALAEPDSDTANAAPRVRCAKMVIVSGAVSAADIERITHYLINPVDSRAAALAVPETLELKANPPSGIPVQHGFREYEGEALAAYHRSMGLAMDMADLRFLQEYFRKEGRDPTETEIRVLDTYWSDHCRHTTFNTVLDSIEIEDGPYAPLFRDSLESYRAMRTELYAGAGKPVTLMDMAVIGAKYLKQHGRLNDIELSEEINACSVYIDVHYTDTDTNERWLLMFKNETHNHPTEIEPFGGAATCIGGAIRDPLSGRSWVYQALRVTGAADPTVPADKTRQGKLPQLKLTREAAAGFSSYGNQIGLTTGQVAEIYHPGFEAKRMELGAVIAAAPADMVVRGTPEPGDVVILIGGGTGRDGIGGATGSSKVHTEQSVTEAAAEVQKGNAVEERKIQRLFRNPEVSRRIRRCNDFGAGGVAVAVGELAPGLDIDLDAVPKKYDGLNGTELAISESQERMAVVVRAEDAEAIMQAARAENLNAAHIARVTDTNRLVMRWRGETIVDIDRAFLDTAGAKRSARARIVSPQGGAPLTAPLASVSERLAAGDVCGAWRACLSDLACCSQRGLCERFDGSIGAATVLFPMGGAYQATPEAGIAAKLPVLPPHETDTASLMAFGYDPRVAEWSPWHGAQTAALQSLARIAAMGGDASSCRLSFQEYFERMTSAQSWGKPAAALLGALAAQKAAGTPAIGGKDSMSGTFEDIHVPPSLVSFAVCTARTNMVHGGAFTAAGRSLWLISVPYSPLLAPDFDVFMRNSAVLHNLSAQGKISACYPIGAGGIAEAVAKMAFGNHVGADIEALPPEKLLPGACSGDAALFVPRYGAVIVETDENLTECGFAETTVCRLGKTCAAPDIAVRAPGATALTLSIKELAAVWEAPLCGVFPQVSPAARNAAAQELPEFARNVHESLRGKAPVVLHRGAARPRVLLPVFPGTNCEYDMARAFSLAGGDARIVVFRNNSRDALMESLAELRRELDCAQILALSGGFSAGDEPDGSGKFIANVLREPRIREAAARLLEERDGLIVGICNGFQALIKTGLVPYGRICEPSEAMPSLTFNTVGRHISRMVRTRMASAVSPWARHESMQCGPDGSPAVHLIPVSHGEGRIIIEENLARELFASGQIFTQYVDAAGRPAMCEPDNPNGSAFAIEGMTSVDGRVLGKMGHSERVIGSGRLGECADLMKNIQSAPGQAPASLCQNLFAAGVRYFD